MSTIKKKELAIGLFLMVTFIAVMVVIFMPTTEDGNALDYLDNLYNSISKGSANYIEKVEHLVGIVKGVLGSVTMMYIKINNSNPFKVALFLGCLSRNRHIAENTKSHCSIASGMMAGRTHKSKPVVQLAIDYG